MRTQIARRVGYALNHSTNPWYRQTGSGPQVTLVIRFEARLLLGRAWPDTPSIGGGEAPGDNRGFSFGQPAIVRYNTPTNGDLPVFPSAPGNINIVGGGRAMRWFRKRSRPDPTSDVAALYVKLGAAATGAAAGIEKYLEMDATAINALRHVRLFTELYAFYLHVMDRTTLDELGPSRRDRLLELSGNRGVQVIDAIIKEFIPDPQSRERAFLETVANVDRAVADYQSAGTLGTVDDREDIFAAQPGSAMGKFSKNVAKALGAEDNAAYRVAALTVVDKGVDKAAILRVGKLL